MDAIENTHDKPEISPFEQICPRHSERIHRHHGCPKCVLEEVHRHESRIHAPLGHERPVPAESPGEANLPPAEII